MKINGLVEKIVNDVKANPIYYLAMLLSITGAYLTADAASKMRFWGFVVWLPANLIVLIGFYKSGNWPPSLYARITIVNKPYSL